MRLPKPVERRRPRHADRRERLVTNGRTPAILSRDMHRERESEQARLDRIERHIKQLAEASAALKVELRIARQLAAERAQALKPHRSAVSRQKPGKKVR